METGRVLRTLIGHTFDVICIAFSPDGRRIATTGYDRTVQLWDTATGREVFTLRGHTAGVVALAFGPDGFRIVSGGLDMTARVWDATPFPAGSLRAQEARFAQKRMELEALGDLAEAGASPKGKNSPSQHGRWDQAAAALGRFVEVDKNNLRGRYLYILSLVEAGNGAGVRCACGDLLRRFGNAAELAQADSVALGSPLEAAKTRGARICVICSSQVAVGAAPASCRSRPSGWRGTLRSPATGRTARSRRSRST